MKQGKEGKMLFFLAIIRIFWPVRQCVRLYFVAGTSIPEQCCYLSVSVFLSSSHNLSVCGRERNIFYKAMVEMKLQQRGN